MYNGIGYQQYRQKRIHEGIPSGSIERALQESRREEQRRVDRERAAGITKGLSSADAAIDAMAANTRELKEKAAADRIRNGVLGKTIGDNAAITAALNEVDGTVKPITLQEKLAALKN